MGATAAVRRRRHDFTFEFETAIERPVWTPKDVSARLIEALRWVQRTQRAGPRGYARSRTEYTASDLVFAQEGWGLREIADPGDIVDPILRVQLPASTIAGHERALQWVADHLADQPTSARVVAAWLHCKVTKARFDDQCVVLGVPRPTAYRFRDRALATIAQALERIGEPLRP